MRPLTAEQVALGHSTDPDLVWFGVASVPFGADAKARAVALLKAMVALKGDVAAAGREAVGPLHDYPWVDARASGKDLEVATVIALTRTRP